MGTVDTKLEFRLGSLDDVEVIADLATAYDPDNPRDPLLLRFTFESSPADEPVVRVLASTGGRTIGYFAAGHNPWVAGATRFGWIRTAIEPGSWTEDRYRELVRAAEDWQRSEGTLVTVERIRSQFIQELDVLDALGYREVR